MFKKCIPYFDLLFRKVYRTLTHSTLIEVENNIGYDNYSGYSLSKVLRLVCPETDNKSIAIPKKVKVSLTQVVATHKNERLPRI